MDVTALVPSSTWFCRCGSSNAGEVRKLNNQEGLYREAKHAFEVEFWRNSKTSF